MIWFEVQIECRSDYYLILVSKRILYYKSPRLLKPWALYGQRVNVRTF